MVILAKKKPMEDKAEFAVKVLRRYALENSVLPRSTSDLSPMESWLILRLWELHDRNENKLPDPPF